MGVSTMYATRGELLYGRYQVIKRLGVGGFGVTYLVKHQKLKRSRVLKVSTRPEPTYRDQFEREAQTLARLEHPNLPDVYDCFVEDDCVCLVMEYIAGKTLAQLMDERESPFEVETVLRWASDLLSALIYLHSQDPPVIHRDIKPSNICITTDDRAVLVDFGIARQLDESRTRTGAQAQSACYAPIEQYTRESVRSSPILKAYLRELRSSGIHTGPYSDVYSLGATLYFALTGNEPEDARWRKLEGIDVDVRAGNPDVPPHVARALKRALALDPRERIETAAELHQLLMEEQMSETWKEDLEAAIARAAIEVLGQEDIREETRARLVSSVLAAYGESPSGFLYVEPCLHDKSMKSPDVVLVHPDVGVLAVVSEPYTLDQISGVRSGKVSVHLHGFPQEQDIVAKAQGTVTQIRHAAEDEIQSVYEGPLFNFVVGLPAISESRWRLEGYDQELDLNKLLLKEHYEQPNRLKRRIQALVRESVARVPFDEPMTKQQIAAMRRAFGDSTVVNLPPRKPAGTEQRLGTYIDDLVNQKNRLSAEQQELSRADFEGHPQLIRGVAGSGKTIVLANNAARFIRRRLQEPDDMFGIERRRPPRVAIICFNRSLVSFIRRKVQRALTTQMDLGLDELPDGVITIRHLNGLFLFELNQRRGGPLTYIPTSEVRDSLERARRYQKQLARLAREDPEAHDAMLFDAVYVDEGQDFEPEEFKLLLEMIRPNEKTGEKSLVIFYDNAQNLYGRRLPTWSSDVGIDIAKGRRSRVMKECFRNARPTVEFAFNVLLGAKAPSGMQVQTRGYADVSTLLRHGLVKELEDRWQVNFTERRGPPSIVREFKDRDLEREWVAREIGRLVEAEGIRPEDILVLCTTRDEAHQVGHAISQQTDVIDGLLFPFEKNMKDRYIFQEGRLTVSTIHSAKGYDAWVVFLLGVDQYDSDVEGRAMFYVGATRPKLLLYVSGVARSSGLLKEARQVQHMLFNGEA
jgi:serine/threonine protein kinase